MTNRAERDRRIEQTRLKMETEYKAAATRQTADRPTADRQSKSEIQAIREADSEYKARRESAVLAARERAQALAESAIQAAKERSQLAARSPPWVMRQRPASGSRQLDPRMLPAIMRAESPRVRAQPVWAHVGEEFVKPGPMPAHLRYLLVPSAHPSAPGFDMERRFANQRASRT